MPRSIMALPVSQTVISRQRHSRRRTEEYSFAMIHWDLQTPPLIYCTICSWLLIVFGSALICCPPIARSRTTVCRRPAAMGTHLKSGWHRNTKYCKQPRSTSTRSVSISDHLDLKVHVNVADWIFRTDDQLSNNGCQLRSFSPDLSATSFWIIRRHLEANLSQQFWSLYYERRRLRRRYAIPAGWWRYY